VYPALLRGCVRITRCIERGEVWGGTKEVLSDSFWKNVRARQLNGT
jgi:hypothetical protein